VRAADLRDRKRTLERERDAIQTQLRARLSGPEEKDRLLAQVRDDNAEIEFMEKQLAEAKAAIAAHKDDLEQGRTDLEQRGDKFDKYRCVCLQLYIL
jgi:chromosome segregation ATPase